MGLMAGRGRCYSEHGVWTEKPRGLPAATPGAHNSAVECHLHTVEVVGSNPAVPTNSFNNLVGVLSHCCGFLWHIVGRLFFSSVHQHRVHRSDHLLRALREFLHVLVAVVSGRECRRCAWMSFTDPSSAPGSPSSSHNLEVPLRNSKSRERLQNPER